MNHLNLLKNDVEGWNRWRLSHAEVICDLAGEDLSHGYFFEGNFNRANLKGAILRRACLPHSDLRSADLSGADLTGAYLGDADLGGANLSHANLTDANLDRANLQGANLLGTQIAAADICVSHLPEPGVELCSDAPVSSLSQSRPAGEPAVMPKKQHSPASRTAVRNVPKRLTAAFRQSLLQQMVLQLQSLTRQSPKAAMLRQQAIRRSAAPLALKEFGAKRSIAKEPISARVWRQMSKPREGFRRRQ